MNNNKKVQGDKIAGITRRTRHRTRLVRDVTMVINSSDAPGEYDWMINNKKVRGDIIADCRDHKKTETQNATSSRCHDGRQQLRRSSSRRQGAAKRAWCDISGGEMGIDTKV